MRTISIIELIYTQYRNMTLEITTWSSRIINQNNKKLSNELGLHPDMENEKGIMKHKKINQIKLNL